MKKLHDLFALLKEEKQNLQTRRSPSALPVAIFTSTTLIPEEEWNRIVPAHKVLMRLPYLKAIENSSTENEQSRYVLIYQDNQPVAAAICHIVTFSGDDYRFSTDDCKPIRKIKSTIKEKAKVRVLVCGHTHISGDHGFIYSPVLSSSQAYHALADACYQIRQAEKPHAPIAINLIKDFYDSEAEASSFLEVFKYRRFKVDPNMLLCLNPEWKTMEDYLQAMTSKYRKKALSVLKQGQGIVRRSLSATEIQVNSPKLQELYLNVANKAKVRINHFDIAYLHQLKINLKDDFELIAYYLEEEMVAFNTLIFWGNNAEAHAIGINYERNATYSLYQNLLYDDVRTAIERKKEKLILGRTAMEMKSNIGAVPYEMWCYVRHSGPLMNRALKPVFQYIKQAEWTPRNPFKEAGNLTEKA